MFYFRIWPIAAMSAVPNVLALVMPLYLLQVYDRVLPSQSYETLLYLTLIAVFCIAVLALLEGARSHYATRSATALDSSRASHAIRASLEDSETGGVNRLLDLQKLRTFLSSRIFLALFDLPFMPLFLFVLYFIHPVLCFLTLGGIIALCILAAFSQAGAAKLQRAGTAESQGALADARVSMRNAEHLRAQGMQDDVIQWWGRRYAQALALGDRATRLSNWFAALSRNARILLQIAILGVGAYLVLGGEMSAGLIFASSIIAGRALQPADQIIGGWPQLIEGVGATRRVRQDSKDELVMGEYKPDEILGALDVRGVSYRSPSAPANAPPIIKPVSFSLEAGASLGIVGASGAGKSTLLRLLSGALQQTSGDVRIDGAEISQWDRPYLGAAVGYLPQEIEFLPGTIGQIISRFGRNVTKEDIYEAAKRANVLDFVLSLPKGFETAIGSRQVRLSGGEKQRIGLAQALYGNPRILILDEPNSNLDDAGERALLRSLQECRQKGVTIVLATHKLELARRLDQVLVLQNGSLANFGPAKEVLVPAKSIKNGSAGSVQPRNIA